MFEPIRPEDYGADTQGRADATKAFTRALREAITRGNHTGHAKLVCNGALWLGSLPVISQQRDTELPQVMCTLEIDATQATFLKTIDNTDGMFHFEGKPFGSKVNAHRFIFNAGFAWGSTYRQPTAWFVRFTDCNLVKFTALQVSGFRCGVLGSNVRYQSENNTYGGGQGGTAKFTRCRHAFAFLGRKESWAYDSTGEPDGVAPFPEGDSFARTRINRAIITDPSDEAQHPGAMLLMQGASLYHSTISDIGGNVTNNGNSLVHTNAAFQPGTVLRDIGFEGANNMDLDERNLYAAPSCTVLTHGPQHRPKPDWQIRMDNVQWRGPRCMPYHANAAPRDYLLTKHNPPKAT